MTWPFGCLVLVRHGETEWNRAGRRQGQLDSPLTEEGARQAEAIASLPALDAIDAIFSSPLGRAYRTAGIIGATVNRSVQVGDDLAEVHHGTFAGLSNDEIEAAHPGELARRERQKYTWSFPEGESYAQADGRASKALQQVAEAPTLERLHVRSTSRRGDQLRNRSQKSSGFGKASVPYQSKTTVRACDMSA